MAGDVKPIVKEKFRKNSIIPAQSSDTPSPVAEVKGTRGPPTHESSSVASQHDRLTSVLPALVCRLKSICPIHVQTTSLRSALQNYKYTTSASYAHFFTSSGVGPVGSSEAAKLHWWNARTCSFVNAPTTLWSTPRLWKRTKSRARQSCGYTSFGAMAGRCIL